MRTHTNYAVLTTSGQNLIVRTFQGFMVCGFGEPPAPTMRTNSSLSLYMSFEICQLSHIKPLHLLRTGLNSLYCAFLGIGK